MDFEPKEEEDKTVALEEPMLDNYGEPGEVPNDVQVNDKP